MKKKECPACALYTEADKKICPFCGYEFPQEQRIFKILAALLVIVFIIFIALSI